MVARAAPAVTREVRCVRPPAARTTAVCDVPPPAGIAPDSATGEVARADGDQLAIGIDRRIAGAGERARPRRSFR